MSTPLPTFRNLFTAANFSTGKSFAKAFTKKLSVFGLITVLSVAYVFAQAPTITSFSPSAGAVGTLVTITGTNLSAPTAFTIGGQAAIVVSNDGSTLVSMVMPNAVTGAISLTTAGGTATGSGNFTITATPFPLAQQGAKLVGTGNVGVGGQGGAVSVSADGNTAIVGGPFDNAGQGAAWVYVRSGGVWAQQGAKLVGTGNTGAAEQGTSVALSADGNTAIVGGFQDNSTQGAAWVYTRSGGVWAQQGAKLVGTGNVNAAFQGLSVSLSADGNTAIVGGSLDNAGQGAAWVYVRSGGVWAQQGAKLVGTGNTGAALQGTSVALSADGNTAIVGGIYDNTQQGAAWVFTNSGGVWAQQGAKLVGAGNTGAAEQGFSVSLSADGNTALVGGSHDNSSQGAAWVYVRGGGVWAQQGTKLVGTGNTGAAGQGNSVSLSADGNTAIVCGAQDNTQQGAAWVYTRSGGVWAQQHAKIIGTGNTGAAGLGTLVALSADGTTAIIGGYTDNSNLGAAWVFIPLATPSAQASNVIFTGTTTTTTTASWTNGDGASRAVFMFAGASGSPAPVDFTAYNANAAFGSGDQIGSTGWYCVYNGMGSTVNITGLTQGTTYQVMAVEYNGTGSNTAYLTTAGAGNPAGVTTVSTDAILANLTISNGTLIPGFSPGSFTYNTTIANFTTGITIVPTTDNPNATITVNSSPVASGVRTSSIPMNVGANTLTIVVTAQDGVTTQTYTVTVNRSLPNNALLTSIALSPTATLVGSTGPDYLDLYATVTNSTASTQVIATAQDNLATITVNGQAVASGSLSQSIPLTVGPTTITTIITAEDGSTKKAVIIVFRPESPVASLANLTISAGTLSPAFATGTINYTASVPYPTASVIITPTTTDPNATVTVNGNAATSGTGSTVALSVGLNKIITKITAQNGANSQNYTTYISRAAPSSNALYTSIALSPAIELVGTPGPGYLNYKVTVPNSETSVQVIATAKDPTATITVNGSQVTSGSPSQVIALNVGSNTLTTVITAQDGVTSKTAIITVTRMAPPVNNNVYRQISVTKPTDNVTLEDGITVRQGVSPNGDGINDYLTIDGISSYPDNRLMIVDRNGVMVYQIKGYDNSTKIFDGHSNINGKIQLPGTYFYSLDYTVNGENKHKTGYIILKY